MTFDDFALIFLMVFAIWNYYAVQQTKHQLRRNMANITERFQGIETKLDEASTEILAELEKLRQTGVTPEGEAILVRLEAKATGLADILPAPTP